jgi:hypothetical protein
MVEMRKRTLLIVLAILVLGSVGTIASTFYSSLYQDFVIFRVSYGFPIGWHGYQLEGGPAQTIYPHPYETYWFTLGSLLLDIAFWFAISLLAVIATTKA